MPNEVKDIVKDALDGGEKGGEGGEAGKGGQESDEVTDDAAERYAQAALVELDHTETDIIARQLEALRAMGIDPDQLVGDELEALRDVRQQLDELSGKPEIIGAEKLKTLDRVYEIMRPDGKAQSTEEITTIINSLRQLQEGIYEDDAIYEAAQEVWLREADYISRTTDKKIVGGAVINGVTVDTEIVGEDLPVGSRPTQEQLDEAAKVMDSTTRGRIMKGLAYMEDYQDVATGTEGQYSNLMPRNLRTELESKSQFSELSPLSKENIAQKNTQESRSWGAELAEADINEVLQEMDQYLTEIANETDDARRNEAVTKFNDSVKAMVESDIEELRQAGEYLARGIVANKRDASASKGIKINFIDSDTSSAIVDRSEKNGAVVNEFSIDINTYRADQPIESLELTNLHEVDHMKRFDVEGSSNDFQKNVSLEATAVGAELRVYGEMETRGTYKDVNNDRLLALVNEQGVSMDKVSYLVARYHVMYPQLPYDKLIELVEEDVKRDNKNKAGKIDTTIASDTLDTNKATGAAPITESGDGLDTGLAVAEAPVESTSEARDFNPIDLLTADDVDIEQFFRYGAETYDVMRKLAVLAGNRDPQRDEIGRKARYILGQLQDGIIEYARKHPDDTTINLNPPRDYW